MVMVMVGGRLDEKGRHGERILEQRVKMKVKERNVMGDGLTVDS